MMQQGFSIADEKKLNVDAFVKYIITRPSDFFIAVQTEANAQNILRPILESSIKSVMQQYELRTILGGDNRPLKKVKREVTGL